MLEEKVSAGNGTVVRFWSVSCRWPFGQPTATRSTWQQTQHCSGWCAEWEVPWLKLCTHILKGRRERKPLQLGGEQAATNSCLEAFLTAMRSVNGALEKILPWVFDAFQPQVFITFNRVEFSAARFPKLSSCVSWLRRERRRGVGEKSQTFKSFLSRGYRTAFPKLLYYSYGSCLWKCNCNIFCLFSW